MRYVTFLTISFDPRDVLQHMSICSHVLRFACDLLHVAAMEAAAPLRLSQHRSFVTSYLVDVHTRARKAVASSFRRPLSRIYHTSLVVVVGYQISTLPG